MRFGSRLMIGSTWAARRAFGNGRLRLPVQRELGRDRLGRARLPRLLLQQGEPGPDRFRREARLQVLSGRRMRGVCGGGARPLTTTGPAGRSDDWTLESASRHSKCISHALMTTNRMVIKLRRLLAKTSLDANATFLSHPPIFCCN